jgi:hypothetical protein
MIMPVTSIMPMLVRAPAPGPRAKTRGRWPITVAAVVIRIGRSRVAAASMTACSLSLPFSWSLLANSTIRMAFFDISPTRVDQADLAVDIEQAME